MQQSTKPRLASPPVLLTLTLLVIAAVTFFVVLVTFNPQQSNQPTPQPVDEASLADTVARLLEIGDASRAEPLLVQYTCTACHRIGTDTVAPQWTILLDAAETRRPPLTAAEYIYESIVNPVAYIVEPYAAAMPQDYAARLSEQELADMLVYLVNGGT